MATCTNCTGTHYLMDDPALGPCLCCTPEAMQARDRTIKALTDPKPLTEQLDELEGMVSDIRDAYREAETRADEAETRAEEAEAALTDTAALVSQYLVSLGLPAQPVTMEAGPLRTVCESVGLL